MRLTAEQRQHNQERIRTVMDQLLRGEIPPGGKCDIKTLARQAGVDRTAFYGTRPYAQLREEFEHRLQELQQAGDTPDPREAQIAGLKDDAAALKQRLADRDRTIVELRDLRAQALSQLAAQHDEITRLRRQTERASNVRRLPSPTVTTGPCS